jgi:hypothetical protein
MPGRNPHPQPPSSLQRGYRPAWINTLGFFYPEEKKLKILKIRKEGEPLLPVSTGIIQVVQEQELAAG